MLRLYRGQRTFEERLSYCNIKELGDSLTVEQRTLTPLVKVRILVPQPTKSMTYESPTQGLVLFAGLLREVGSAPRNTTISGQRPSRSHTFSAASINRHSSAAE